MSATYASRFKDVFLCTHQKGPKMYRIQAANYRKKSKGLRKQVGEEIQTKTVADSPDRCKSKNKSVAEDCGLCTYLPRINNHHFTLGNNS